MPLVDILKRGLLVSSSNSREDRPEKRQKVSDNPDQPFSREEIDARNERIASQRREQAIDMANKNRSVNTTKSYKKAQKEWASFCSKYDFSDGDYVTPDKLIWFTQEVILAQKVKQKCRKQKQDDQMRLENSSLVEEDKALVEATALAYQQGVQGVFDDPGNDEGSPLKHSSVVVWVSAIVDLYNIQIAKGLHSNPHPRNFAVRNTLKMVQSTAWRRIRELHEDRAVNTILDAYTTQELQNFVRHCWSAPAITKLNVDSYSRTLLDFLIGHYFLVRGELRRKAELADMFILELPNESQSQKCCCWIFVFDNGKTNVVGKKQYLGALRHRDFRVCPIGALAMYFFVRFHLKKEPWPSFQSLHDWDRIKLLRGGADREKELNEKTQRDWIKDVFKAVGISTSKTTHAGRKTGAQHAEILGVPEADVSDLPPLYKVSFSTRSTPYFNKSFILLKSFFFPFFLFFIIFYFYFSFFF
jgi:hypothetical protein